MLQKEIQAYQKALFEFLDWLLYAAFMMKREDDDENLSMRGLVITEKELDQAFLLLHKRQRLPEEVLDDLAQIEINIHLMEQELGDALPFYCLCQDFALTDLERLAFLLAVAPCFDRKYEKIYGYLQDNVNISSPTRGLCISLAELIGTPEEEEVSAFLSKTGDIEYFLVSSDMGLSDAYKLQERVQNYLFGIEISQECLRRRLTYFDKNEPLDEILIRKEYLEKLKNLFSKMQEEEPEESSMILLCGEDGIGKRFLMKHFAASMGLRLLMLELSEMDRMNEKKRHEILEALIVEAALSKACICLIEHEIEIETDEEEGQSKNENWKKQIMDYLGDEVPCFFMLSQEKGSWFTEFKGNKVCLELPSLLASERIVLWKAYSLNYSLESEVNLEQIGNKYLLTCRGILDVLNTAKMLSTMEGKTLLGEEHIRQAVRQNQKNQLGVFAQLLNSPFTWEDLILGEESKRQMRMVCDQLKYRDVVGEQWGFHKKTPYGRGLSVLFYGPPGTGKTMAAQVIANELGLDLYRIDISQMVSKYIGETQKNISRLFQKAKGINALLFFDEADSLFAKRSEAKDSHDRNANAETAHLLQKLEEYDGITVLATNYLNNIDDAFKRRIKFIIHVAFPESSVRLNLWQSMLPAQAKCDEDLDFEFFAENFELSGSSIKEILVNAAYLAAAQHRGLKNCDVIEAVKLNFAKYGKILTKADFGYLVGE